MWLPGPAHIYSLSWLPAQSRIKKQPSWHKVEGEGENLTEWPGTRQRRKWMKPHTVRKQYSRETSVHETTALKSKISTNAIIWRSILAALKFVLLDQVIARTRGGGGWLKSHKQPDTRHTPGGRHKIQKEVLNIRGRCVKPTLVPRRSFSSPSSLSGYKASLKPCTFHTKTADTKY